MGLTFLKLIGILTILTYLATMLFMKGSKNKIYLFFILFSFPFLHILIFNDFTAFDLITVIHLISFAKSDKVNRSELNIYNIVILILFLTIITGYLLSSFNIETDNWFRMIRFFIIFIFCMILISTAYNDDDFFTQWQNRFPLLIMFCIFFLGMQILFGLSVSLVKTLNPNVILANGIRYPGIFSDPQQFAQFLGASSFLLLLRFNSDEKIKKLNWLLFSLCLIGIFAAGGRAGLMGWSLGLFLFILFSNPRYKIYIFIFTIVSGVIIFFFQDKLAIFNRGTDLQDTYDFRAQIWFQAFQIFLENPIVGIGLGNYSDYVMIYLPDQMFISNNELVAFDHPESGYLLYLTEIGGLGFLSFIFLILFPIAKAIVAYFKYKDMNHILIISAATCWIVGFYSTNSLGDTRMKILVATIFGIMISYRLKQNRDTESDDSSISEIVDAP
jgi:O-antigen ligase